MKLSIFIILMFSISTAFAQQKHKLTVDARTGKPMLMGEVNRKAFQDSSFASWFNTQYKFYKPDAKTEEALVPGLKDKKIEIVMGTWCSDSRREVPRVLKVLDEANFPDSSLEIITINRKIKSIDNKVDSLHIKRVPTIIVYENGKELGRIIESPIETLEKDLENIVGKQKK